ncbi:MAG: hypothetical protein JWO98_5294 [Frankiales bacterium]|nr:hypothetical protein [Frankiales bacterium]
MPSYVGSTAPSSFYVGSVKCTAVYMGSTLIWPLTFDSGKGANVAQYSDTFTGTNGAAPAASWTVVKNVGTVTIQSNAMVIAPPATAWAVGVGAALTGPLIVSDANYQFDYTMTNLAQQYPAIVVRATTSALSSSGAGAGLPATGIGIILEPNEGQLEIQTLYNNAVLAVVPFTFVSATMSMEIDLTNKTLSIKIWTKGAAKPTAWTYQSPIMFDESAGFMMFTAANGPAATAEKITIDNFVATSPAYTLGSAVPAPTAAVTGFNLVYSENFDTAAAANSSVGTNTSPFLTAYANSVQAYTDASPYYASSQLSAHDGVLDVTMDGTHGAAAVFGTAATAYARNGGKFSMRAKALGAIGNGTAVMVWPSSDVWDEGEIDYPESNFEVEPFVHQHIMNGSGDDTAENLTYGTGATWREWHVYSVEWVPGVSLKYYLDDVLVASSTTQIPTTAHRYMFQVGNYGSAGHLYIDWVNIYAIAP